MAYSFARSGRESYGANRNQSPERRGEDSLSESRNESGPEYLDLGFAWLNDYDKAGNYRPNANRTDELTQTRQENPYGWNALGPTRRVPSRTSEERDLRQSTGDDSRQNGAAQLRQTNKRGIRQTNRGDLQRSTGADLRQTGRNDFQHTDSNGDFRQTSRNELGQTSIIDTRRTQRDDLRNTRTNEHRVTVQLENLSETQKENPYGWRALGPTRRVPSFTTGIEDITRSNNFRTTITNNADTVDENPYGWKALGRTRPPPSHSPNTESTARKSRKRTYQTSFARKGSRTSRGEQQSVTSNEARKIKHAMRLSTLPEENIRNGSNTRDRDFRATAVDGDAISTTEGGILTGTTGGGYLRGTTYDYPYARNKIRKSSQERNSRQPVSSGTPERRHIVWAGTHTPEDTSRHWTDMATDHSLMRKWYELFAKIKKRWAANYRDPSLLSGLSEETDFRPATITTRTLNKRRQVSGRRKLALLGAVVFIILLVAIVVPVSILTGQASEKESPSPKDDMLWEYMFQATILNRVFKEEMSNILTEAFQNISRPFCYQIDDNSVNLPYEGCKVTLLSEGSVVVNFSVVLKASEQNPPAEINVKAALGLNSTEQFRLGPFELSGNVTVLPKVLIQNGSNPIPNEKDFNMTCTDVDLCKTNFSLCINGTCSCPYNRYHEESYDTCMPIFCGEIPEVANGTVNASGSFYGNKLTIECDIGYELSENISVPCTSNDSWKTHPTCNIIQCEDFIIPDHAMIDSETFQNRTFQEEITLSCEEGFELTGGNKTTCQADKTWSNVSMCDRINCTEPDFPDNVFISSENNSYAFESVIKLTCSSGYILEGEGNISCQANKTWAEFPTCTPVTCPTFQFPDNAAEKNVTDKIFEDRIVIECLIGYNISGNDTVECLADGTWSESPNCTIIDCGDLEEPVNGTIKSNNGTKFNMTQTVSCNEGFKLKDGGTGIVTCTRYGNWSDIPECELKTCPNVNAPENGIIAGDNSTTINSELIIECFPGFDLVGNSSVICMEDETWSEFPKCELVKCGHPIKIENGNYLKINETTFNSTISVECLDGYELSGSATILCESTGNWTGSPKCLPINCSLTNISDNFNTSGLQDNFFSVNSSVILNCNSGFIMQGNNNIICQSNGSWTAIPECTPVVCLLFDKPNNSMTFDFNDTTDFHYSDIVKIECNIGYNLSGNESVTCKEDGNWTTVPECLKVQCDSYKLENGQTGNQTFYSEILDIECDFGYELSNNNSVICSDDGTWTGNSTCEVIDCEEFTPPECEVIPAVYFSESATTAQIGDPVQLQCILVGTSPSSDIVISRNSAIQQGKEHVCNASQIGHINCSFEESENGDKMTATISVDQVECKHEGTYYCESASNNSLSAAMNLSVTNPAEGIPMLTLQPEVITNWTVSEHNITCSANVGYPAGDLRIEYRSDNFTSFEIFNLGIEETTEDIADCSVNKSIAFREFAYTEKFNNTEIRCAVYNHTNDTVPVQISNTKTVELI
ncbi:uncharacterized protein LOC128558464 [Mercenaria mercenaria]|uniref:uncharacterized protein LOC128558464 n=1 Tax=Mercenaria mercenaria TaxID=6596 RepID=UPI00234F0613|nr:uncharacterized protein LOC128558464 [Mercenaria mercenaria]